MLSRGEFTVNASQQHGQGVRSAPDRELKLIRLSQLKPGLKFNDSTMATQPAHRRIHIVVAVGESDMRALHIASGAERTFNLTSEALEALKVVPSEPDATADLDCLVGKNVRLKLKDGGSVKGRCTGILYHNFEIDGVQARTIASFELDRSGTTTYGANDITQIETTSK